jgi:hypothetical protein
MNLICPHPDRPPRFNWPPQLPAAAVRGYVEAQRDALIVERDAVLADLRSACAMSVRQQYEFGEGMAGASIDKLRTQLTVLEGQIEYFAQALVGLDG